MKTTMRLAVLCLAFLSLANAAIDTCRSRDPSVKSNKFCQESYDTDADCKNDLNCVWADGPWKDDANGYCVAAGRCKTERPANKWVDAQGNPCDDKDPNAQCLEIVNYAHSGSQNQDCRFAMSENDCLAVAEKDLGGGRKSRTCGWVVEEKDCLNLRYKSFCESRSYCNWVGKGSVPDVPGQCNDLARCFSGEDAAGNKTNPYCRFKDNETDCLDEDSYIGATGLTVPGCEWRQDNEYDCSAVDKYKDCQQRMWCHWGDKDAPNDFQPQCDMDLITNDFFFLDDANSPYDFLGRACINMLVFDASVAFNNTDQQDEYCDCFKKVPRAVVDHHMSLLTCYTPDHAAWKDFFTSQGVMLGKDPNLYEAMTQKMCSMAAASGMCTTDDIVCENGGSVTGTLDLDNCDCNCIDNYTGTNCEIPPVTPKVCSDASDAASCGQIDGCEFDPNMSMCKPAVSTLECELATKEKSCVKLCDNATCCEWDPLDKACVIPIPAHPCNLNAEEKPCNNAFKKQGYACTYKKAEIECTKTVDPSNPTGKKVKNCAPKPGSTPICVNEQHRPDCIGLGKSCTLWTHCMYHPQHKALAGYETCLPADDVNFSCNGASSAGCKLGPTCVTAVWRTESKKKACYDGDFVPDMPKCDGLDKKECKKAYFRLLPDGSYEKMKAKKVCSYDKKTKICSVSNPSQYSAPIRR